MKKYINIKIIIAFISITLFALYQHKQVIEYRNKFSISKGNEEAYNSSLSKDRSKANVYQMSISDLKQSNDSLTQELLKVQKEKKIKKGKQKEKIEGIK